MRFSFGQFGFDTAEVHLAYTQVRGDVVLGHTLDNMWAVIDKVLVALFGRIPDDGDKFIDIVGLPLNGHLQDQVYKTRFMTEVIEQLVHMFFGKQVYDRRFYGFDGDGAGNIIDKAVEGGKPFIFEKKLNRDIRTVFIEVGADEALFDVDVILRSFPFFEK